jgi:polar amino acid transport system substrate-binding protein
MTSLGLANGAFAQNSAKKPVIDQIKERGVMRVGVSTFVPWAMRDKKGELVGYEIDVAKRLGEDLKVKVDFIPTSWDGIIPALSAGKFDAIIGGLSPTPAREKMVDFVHPDSHTGTGAVANKKLAEGKHTFEDFNNPDVTIVMRRGSATIPVVKEKMPKAKLLLFDDDAQAAQEMLNGKADLFLASEPRPTYLNIDNPATTFKPFKQYVLETTEAIAIRKGDAITLKAFNDWVDARTQDGFLEARRKYWFGSRDWADQVPK